MVRLKGLEPSGIQQKIPFRRKKSSTEAKIEIMFGLGDISIAIAMLGSVAVTGVCLVYGIINWNKDDDSQGGKNE